MLINMDNPTTALEKVDAAANLVEQMHLAHMMKDEKKFKEAHQRAGALLRDAVEMLDEQENKA